jgi:hypothetical protein
MHQLGDSKPTQRPWHMDVGNKQGEDSSPSFDKPCRFVAVFGLEDLKPGLDKLLSQDVTDQSFVFDEKNAQGLHPRGLRFCRWLTHLASLVLCVTPCFLLKNRNIHPTRNREHLVPVGGSKPCRTLGIGWRLSQPNATRGPALLNSLT